MKKLMFGVLLSLAVFTNVSANTKVCFSLYEDEVLSSDNTPLMYNKENLKNGKILFFPKIYTSGDEKNKNYKCVTTNSNNKNKNFKYMNFLSLKYYAKMYLEAYLIQVGATDTDVKWLDENNFFNPK